MLVWCSKAKHKHTSKASSCQTDSPWKHHQIAAFSFVVPFFLILSKSKSILVAVELHPSTHSCPPWSSWLSLRQCVDILTDSTEVGQIQYNQCRGRDPRLCFYRAGPPGRAPLHLPSSLAHSAAERAGWKGSISLVLCGGSTAPLSSEPQTDLVINMAAVVRGNLTQDYTMVTHWHNSLIGVAG